MEKTQVMVYFSLFADEFPLETVTKRLGVDPTESYNKGDLIRKISATKNLVRQDTAWKLSTGYQESLDVEIQLEQIVKQIRDKETAINELKIEFDLECRFTIVIIMNDGYTPALCIGLPIIKFANSIKADFDIDLYSNPYVDTDD
ncbi:DUF4279 domain-containing protein [Rummeliibacillus sp. NPDC094406]|uniref:DUF4279 domain-containing protein n=1 Tax=Rummeliibacillus sp. NPDC094406 TaxID=3364511 RepID=UPI0037F74E27